MSGDQILRVAGVTRRFGGLIAVNDVSLTVRRGEILGLIGPNGSGKSTLLSVISGRLPTTYGEIFVGGRRTTDYAAEEICRAGIAATFQLVRMPDSLSAQDNVAVAAMYGRMRMGVREARQEAGRLLERVHFSANRNAHAEALTYFDQKRVELARALACAPDILLLDEWLAGLNPSELEDAIVLVRSLNEDGITVVLVEHVMHAIRSLCAKVVVLNAGRVIASGTPEGVLAIPEVTKVYLGEDA